MFVALALTPTCVVFCARTAVERWIGRRVIWTRKHSPGPSSRPRVPRAPFQLEMRADRVGRLGGQSYHVCSAVLLAALCLRVRVEALPFMLRPTRFLQHLPTLNCIDLPLCRVRPQGCSNTYMGTRCRALTTPWAMFAGWRASCPRRVLASCESRPCFVDFVSQVRASRKALTSSKYTACSGSKTQLNSQGLPNVSLLLCRNRWHGLTAYRPLWMRVCLLTDAFGGLLPGGEPWPAITPGARFQFRAPWQTSRPQHRPPPPPVQRARLPRKAVVRHLGGATTPTAAAAPGGDTSKS